MRHVKEPTMATKTRSFAYLPVSTEKQADKGVSLDAQRAMVEAHAQLYELDLVEVIVDAGVSAKTLDRPGTREGPWYDQGEAGRGLAGRKARPVDAKRRSPRRAGGGLLLRWEVGASVGRGAD